MSEAFIEVLLLLMHMQIFRDTTPVSEFQVVEFFAGSARIATLAKKILNLPVCALDKEYVDGHAMDINSNAGFLLPD